jgi:glucokinase
MTIDPKGAPGQYGNLGALEKYVGNRQIAERAQALYREVGLTKTLEECSPLALESSARAGDMIAQRVWSEVGFAIGIALCDVIWLLNPDRIVIGGGVAHAGEYLFGPIREVIEARTMRIFHEGLTIVPAKLGNDAGIIGSGALALAKMASLESRPRTA